MGRSKGILCFGVFVCTALFLSVFIYAQSINDLTIMTENYPPYNYEEDGTASGFSTEIVREIMLRNNISTKINVLSWPRAYEFVQAKENQVLYSMSRTKERENLFKWVGPIVEYEVVFFKKKGSPVTVNSLDDAKKVDSIGTGQKTSATLYLESQGFTNLDPISDPLMNVRKLFYGRNELWLSGDLSGIHRIKKAGYKPSDFEIEYVIRKEELYIAFSKDVPQNIIDTWQKTLDEIKKDGTFDKVKSRYMN